MVSKHFVNTLTLLWLLIMFMGLKYTSSKKNCCGLLNNRSKRGRPVSLIITLPGWSACMKYKHPVQKDHISYCSATHRYLTSQRQISVVNCWDTQADFVPLWPPQWNNSFITPLKSTRYHATPIFHYAEASLRLFTPTQQAPSAQCNREL